MTRRTTGSVGSPPPLSPNTHTNVAFAYEFDLATIRQLEPCTAYGVEGDGEHCTVIYTPNLGDDYARARAIVSFRID